MIRKQFGKRIRSLRRAKGISQEKLALKIEMDRSYYASVEAGRRNVSLVNINKIAKGLEIPLHELFEELDDG